MEIHLDIAEDWYYGFDIASNGKISLFTVLLHEIGHSLGLAHTSDMYSIMYSFYSGETMSLSKDDIADIQQLYSTKQTKIPTAIPNTTAPVIHDLCEVKPNKFLITSNQHMYIFHNDLAWVYKIGDKAYRSPEKIQNYLPFSSFSHIYQRPSGDSMIIIGNSFCIVEFPSLVVKNAYNKKSIQELGLYGGRKINCIFNSYLGKTYILYDNYYYLEFDECSFQPKTRGIIADKFPGISTHVDGAFRYINGNIYFFRNNTFFEFNEFNNKVTRAGELDLSIFGITCPNEDVLTQIRDLLGKLII